MEQGSEMREEGDWKIDKLFFSELGRQNSDNWTKHLIRPSALEFSDLGKYAETKNVKTGKLWKASVPSTVFSCI